MKKEELIILSESFMHEAFQANCYYNIINQYSENIKEYHEEINFSGAFYMYTYNALVVATFMELAKIFDSNDKSINIYRLMDICKDHIALFPQQREFKMIIEGKETIKKFPYKHAVSPEEEEFFLKEVENQKQFYELLGVSDVPIDVEMTIERYFALYKWKYENLKPQIKNLLKQRNKVYAHNDENSLYNVEKVIFNFPINKSDIESLISFALEFCQFVIALLTGVYKAQKPLNINDWKGTLNLVRLGYKYKDDDEIE
jgi:hypothetical protein